MPRLPDVNNPVFPKPLALSDLPMPYPEHVEEFRQVYEQHFGVRLSTKQATEQLTHLLAFVRYRQANAEHKQRQHQDEK